MKILVIGGGGREHALVWKLGQSRGVSRIFCAPGNAGTLELGENVPIAANDLPALAGFARENRIELWVADPATGAARYLLSGCHLVWSPDGRFLAMKGEHDKGVGIVDVTSGDHMQLTSDAVDVPTAWAD